MTWESNRPVPPLSSPAVPPPAECPDAERPEVSTFCPECETHAPRLVMGYCLACLGEMASDVGASILDDDGGVDWQDHDRYQDEDSERDDWWH